MPSKKLFITDQRMFDLVEWALQKGYASDDREYYQKIELARNCLASVERLSQGFTKGHIHNFCLLTRASADYTFGFSNSIQRQPSKQAIDMLHEPVMAVEGEIINGS